MAVTRFRQKCSSAHHIFNGRTFDYSAEQKKNIQREMVGKVKSQTRLSKKQKDFSNRPALLELLPQFSGVRIHSTAFLLGLEGPANGCGLLRPLK
jgi:hypothetical protein